MFKYLKVGRRAPFRVIRCAKNSLWQCRIDERIMSAFPFQNEEQGESLGAAEIRAALGCYAYSGA